MKQKNHQFMRAMLFIAVLLTSFMGVAASAPASLTEGNQQQCSAPSIYVGEGVGKYNVSISAYEEHDIYCRINSGEWFRYKYTMVFDVKGSYTVEAYCERRGYAPSNIVSKSFVVNEHTGETLVDPDANNSSIIFHNGFKYKINGSTLALTDQNDAMCNGDLVIPSKITHNGVTYTVTQVESWACYNLYNLTSVQIPSTVTDIGLYAFNSCPRLRSITVNSANPNYSDRDGVLYNKNGKYLLCYPNARATSYTIPSDVTMIYYSAFQEDFDLESVTIPSSVTSIRTSAFSCCYSLQSIVLPPNLGNMDAGVFSSCRELKSVTLSTGYNRVPEWAFSGCTSLESIVMPDCIRTIAYGAFEECSGLRSVTFNQGLKTIEETAFTKCYSLEEVTIPRYVSSIQESAFYRCTGLQAIHVDPDNTYYCDVDGVLYNKNKTILMTYPYGSPRESYDVLPCTQTISKRAFDCCYGIKRINIPPSVTSIGEQAFMYCTSLTSINIPDGVTTLPTFMLAYCTSLKEVTIPASVTSISSWALENGSLMTVNCLATTPPSMSNGFASATYQSGTLLVSSASVEAYRAANGWSKFVNIKGISAGDADGDGMLSVTDATSIIDYILSGTTDSFYSINADIDGDGVVSVSDVTAILDMLLSEN